MRGCTPSMYLDILIREAGIFLVDVADWGFILLTFAQII